MTQHLSKQAEILIFVCLGFSLRVIKVSTGIAANSQTQPLSGMQIQIDFTMSMNTSQKRFLKNQKIPLEDAIQ